MEIGNVLIVTKLDSLGRHAMDVRATVEQLEAAGVRVHCLALGGVDRTSPAGKMTMQVINAVAELEHDLFIERMNSGIKQSNAEGKKSGCPPALTKEQKGKMLRLRAKGVPVAQLARQFETTRQTIRHIRASSTTVAGSRPVLLTSTPIKKIRIDPTEGAEAPLFGTGGKALC